MEYLATSDFIQFNNVFLLKSFCDFCRSLGSMARRTAGHRGKRELTTNH